MGLQDIHISGIILAIAEIVGNFLIIPFGNVLKRRRLNFFCSFILGMASVCVLAIDLIKNYFDHPELSWLQVVISILIKLTISANTALLYTYISELFPTKLRGLCIAFAIFIGRLGTVFSVGIDYVTNALFLHPMSGLMFSAFIALPMTLYLPETLGKGMENWLFNFLIIFEMELKYERKI